MDTRSHFTPQLRDKGFQGSAGACKLAGLACWTVLLGTLARGGPFGFALGALAASQLPRGLFARANVPAGRMRNKNVLDVDR
ncbi:MAG TPA: hypothetical protein VKF40_21675 [Burkholderiales bacterium]|nr:hypothetical protein [Burkholderiales bacterium]